MAAISKILVGSKIKHIKLFDPPFFFHLNLKFRLNCMTQNDARVIGAVTVAVMVY
jgi:hypothetical protein